LIPLLLPGLAAGLIAWCLTPLSIRIARRVGAIDTPGPRRVHMTPIPRLGGLAVVTAVAAVVGAFGLFLPGSLGWTGGATTLGPLAGLIPILLVSVRDDISHVGAFPKLLAQATGAGIAMWFGVLLPPTVHLFGYPIALGWMAYPLSALWIVGVTNAFNLVDGLDGLSAGLGLISCIGLAAVLLMAGRPANASAAIVLAGALLGFLPYNMHPARVFLGDTGATAVGYMLACLTLTSSALLSAGFAALLPILLVGIPVADTLVSILRRTIGRLEDDASNRVHEADRNHIHHRLLDLGLSHRKAVFLLYGAGAFLSAIAFLSLLLTRQQSGLLLLGLFLAGVLGLQRLGYGEFALLRRGGALRVYDLPMMRRAFFAAFVDIALAGLALYLAAVLKLDSWSFAGKRGLLYEALALLVPAQVIAFAVFGIYKDSWRLAGVQEFLRLGLAIAAASLMSLALASALGIADVPPLLFVIYAFVALVVTTGSRVSFRLLDHIRLRGAQGGVPALIYGSGQSGSAAVREMLSNPASGLRPAGFLDDDPIRVGRQVNGYQVMGGIDGLAAAIAKTGAGAVVISSLKVSDERVRHAQEICDAAGVRLLRMNIGFDEHPVAEAARGVEQDTGHAALSAP
jgi:UDP-GlcNAc:undecaprenyl-phosphate GlcNAc-1-phosphate transferase